MTSIWIFFDWLEKKMRTIGAICLFGMMAVTCADVIFRGFGYPIFGSEEMVSFLLTLVIAFSLPFSHLEKVHVGVEILFRLFSARVRVILSLLTNIFSLVLMILITVMMFDFSATTRESGEVSMNLEFPEYSIIFALAVCFLIFNFFILRDILDLSRIKESIQRFTNMEGDA